MGTCGSPAVVHVILDEHIIIAKDQNDLFIHVGKPLIFGIGESMSGVLVRVCGGLAMDSGAMVSLDIGRTACNWVGMWVGMLWGGVGCMGVRRKLRGRAWII